MPAKRMKPNFGKDCSRENELHTATKVSQRLHCEDMASHRAACPAVDISGDNITPANDSVMDGLFHHLSTTEFSTPSSLSGSMSTDGKGSISTADPVIDQMIFSPLFDDVEFQDMILAHSIEGSEFPFLVPDDRDDTCCMSIDCDRSCKSFQLCTPPSFCRNSLISDSLEDHYYDSNLLDYDIMFDAPDKYMILPFLERTKEENYASNEAVNEDAHHSLDLSPCRAAHQTHTSHSPNVEDSIFLDLQLFVDSFPDPSEFPSMWAKYLPKENQRNKTVTLVLDLDETLVHSTLEHCADADFTFPVSFNTKEHTVYVRQRPYLRVFLEQVSKMFKIVIFTASQSIYASQLLDILDPDKSIISRRIYRESCVFSEGIYTKDLSILGADLAKVIIIDNSPQVFRFQVSNGIPIKSWFDDPSDCALISLLPFLETLADADDVRPIISERFKKE